MTKQEELAAAMAKAQSECPYSNGGPNHSQDCRNATIAYAVEVNKKQSAN